MQDEMTAIEKLEQQKISLERHLRQLETEIQDTGRHLAAVQEHLHRLKTTGCWTPRRPKLKG